MKTNPKPIGSINFIFKNICYSAKLKPEIKKISIFSDRLPHANTHTYAYIYNDIQTHKHTQVYAHVSTHKCIRSLTCSYTHLYTYAHKHSFTRIAIYSRIPIYTRIHNHIITHKYACSHTPLYIITRALTDTFTHTNTCAPCNNVTPY